ncbi:hypothetical protein C7437_10396 [Psychrobacillus insolitus]|uniref:WGR domain-containing protein n=1 Tax=Psychrobacillus insolitus TaxID=1461 RepID=A0A2W7MLP1_9BACI|nr:hypothetical protein [Psychrobacillus insolitus]PZX04847.1 hypothetical protein C7437_10396 [Psychrobacillus insolitus]
MIRLIKKVNNEMHYWQVWKLDKDIFTQFGTLGVIAEKEEIQRKFFESSKKVMRSLAKEKQLQGYEYIDEEALIKVFVQYRSKDKEQFEEVEEKSLSVEDLLDYALFSTGNGSCDGSEIGDDGGTNYCSVISIEIALETILKELSTNNLLDGIEIAFLNEDGEYVSLYPEGAVFEIL